MKITARFLVQHAACSDQVRLFRRLYPRGLTVSASTLVQAAREGLSIFWLEQFIPEPLWDDYVEACRPLYDALEAGVAPLLATALRDVEGAPEKKTEGAHEEPS